MMSHRNVTSRGSVSRRELAKFVASTLVTLVVVPTLAACSSEAATPLKEAELVSAKGSLSPQEGELDVAVSPQNDDGAFIGHDLPKSAFAFENVTIRSLTGGTEIEAA